MKIAIDWDNEEHNNNGYIYGIEHQDENENVIDIEWFKSQKERDNNLSKKFFRFGSIVVKE